MIKNGLHALFCDTKAEKLSVIGKDRRAKVRPRDKVVSKIWVEKAYPTSSIGKDMRARNEVFSKVGGKMTKCSSLTPSTGFGDVCVPLNSEVSCSLPTTGFRDKSSSCCLSDIVFLLGLTMCHVHQSQLVFWASFIRHTDLFGIVLNVFLA